MSSCFLVLECYWIPSLQRFATVDEKPQNKRSRTLREAVHEDWTWYTLVSVFSKTNANEYHNVSFTRQVEKSWPNTFGCEQEGTIASKDSPDLLLKKHPILQKTLEGFVMTSSLLKSQITMHPYVSCRAKTTTKIVSNASGWISIPPCVPVMPSQFSSKAGISGELHTCSRFVERNIARWIETPWPETPSCFGSARARGHLHAKTCKTTQEMAIVFKSEENINANCSVLPCSHASCR